MFKESDKGVAVPTCVTVNNLVQYYTPIPSEAYTLKAGDVVKMYVPVRFIGYCLPLYVHLSSCFCDPLFLTVN